MLALPIICTAVGLYKAIKAKKGKAKKGTQLIKMSCVPFLSPVEFLEQFDGHFDHFLTASRRDS